MEKLWIGVSFNLKSSFKCVREGEEDLWHVRPKMRGQKEKCSHKRSATCVCVPGITSLPYSRIYTVGPDVSQQFGFVFFLYLLPQRKRNLKRPQKKKKNSFFFFPRLWLGNNETTTWPLGKFCVCKKQHLVKFTLGKICLMRTLRNFAVSGLFRQNKFEGVVTKAEIQTQREKDL